jgi:hypothetical protein
MRFLDLTAGVTGRFATHLLAQLGHTVMRIDTPLTPMDAALYGEGKVAIAPAEMVGAAGDCDAWIRDDEAFHDATLAPVIEAVWAQPAGRASRVEVTGIGPGDERRVTSFVLDHALGFSAEHPAGSPYRAGYDGPRLALPGRLTEHDAGVQLALGIVACAGNGGELMFSVAHAAAVTHRLAIDRIHYDRTPFYTLGVNAGIPFGGLLAARDGWAELVLFVHRDWHGLAELLGAP